MIVFNIYNLRISSTSHLLKNYLINVIALITRIRNTNKSKKKVIMQICNVSLVSGYSSRMSCEIGSLTRINQYKPLLPAGE